jgi:hypothetical protein
VLKGAFADRLVVVTAFLVVLLSATLVAAIPIYAGAVAESSLRERLERAPATEANVQATVNVFGGSGDRPLDERVESVARDVFSGTGVSIFRSGESETFTAAGRSVVFGFFDDLSRHARLVAGRWPGAATQTVEVAVPDVVARTLRLREGRLIRARSRLAQNHVVGARVPLRCTGGETRSRPLGPTGRWSRRGRRSSRLDSRTQSCAGGSSRITDA